MLKNLTFLLLIGISCAAFGQGTQTPVSEVPKDENYKNVPSTTTNALLAKAKTIRVVSDTYFVKKEELEKGLLKRDEFDRWGLQIVQNVADADLILKLKRAAFQNNFVYTLTDRATGRIVLGGEVNSLGGTVPGKVARRIMHKLKESHEPQESKDAKDVKDPKSKDDDD